MSSGKVSFSWWNQLTVKDLYAIKHALEARIKEPGRDPKDIEHEKRIIDKIVNTINEYCKTEAHYDKEVKGK